MPTSLCTYRHCYCCSVDLVDISPLVHINLSRSMLDPQQTVLPLGSSSVNFIFTHTHIYTHTPARMHKKKQSTRIHGCRAKVYSQHFHSLSRKLRVCLFSILSQKDACSFVSFVSDVHRLPSIKAQQNALNAFHFSTAPAVTKNSRF